VIRALVASSCGAPVGTTSMTDSPVAAAGDPAVADATPGALRTAETSLFRAGPSLGAPHSATSTSGPLEPAPKP
jgi:hypothetical protein